MFSIRHPARLAAAVAALATVAVPAADARTAYSGNACQLLSTKQVTALGIAISPGGRACTEKTGKPNPYYTGVSAIWGKLGAGHGSLILAVNKVASHTYINVFESQNKTGKSVGVGSWSRGSCAGSRLYCIVTFVADSYVVELQVALPTSHPLASSKQVITMAKGIAAKLT